LVTTWSMPVTCSSGAAIGLVLYKTEKSFARAGSR
jgi:hypothetical protein